MGVPGIVPALHTAPLRDRDGLLLGRVEDLLFDAVTNRLAWVVVRLGDGRRTVAPAARSRPGLDGLRVAVGADVVQDCPVTLVGGSVLQEHLVAASRHYGIRRFARGGAFTSAGPALDAVRAA
jgi:hypothetical protein